MTDHITDRPAAPNVLRQAYVAVCALLVVAVLAQFYFAAFGVFTAPEPADDSQFVLHATNGRMILPGLMLIAILTAWLARAPGRLVGFTALPLGLLVGQTILFIIAGITGSSPERTNLGGRVILGFHAINGLAILLTCLILLRRARAHSRRTTATAVPAPEAARQP